MDRSRPQDRTFLRCIIQSIGALQPGHVRVIPFVSNATPLLFVVQRYSRPDHDRCDVALVSCDAPSLTRTRTLTLTLTLTPTLTLTLTPTPTLTLTPTPTLTLTLTLTLALTLTLTLAR